MVPVMNLVWLDIVCFKVNENNMMEVGRLSDKYSIPDLQDDCSMSVSDTSLNECYVAAFSGQNTLAWKFTLNCNFPKPETHCRPKREIWSQTRGIIRDSKQNIDVFIKWNYL